MISETYPKNVLSFCPRCGGEGFNSEEKDVFFCQLCDFHLYINAAAAVAALLFDNQNRLFFTKRANDPCKGMLDLPGGFVDTGETAEDALKRELKEELSIEINAFSYVASFPNHYPYKGLTYFTLDLAYSAHNIDFKDIKLSDEIAGYELISPEKINYDEIGFESLKNVIKLWLNMNL